MKIWLQINNLLLEAGKIYSPDKVRSQIFEEISLIVLLLLLLDGLMFSLEILIFFFKDLLFVMCILFLG